MRRFFIDLEIGLDCARPDKLFNLVPSSAVEMFLQNHNESYFISFSMWYLKKNLHANLVQHLIIKNHAIETLKQVQSDVFKWIRTSKIKKHLQMEVFFVYIKNVF